MVTNIFVYSFVQKFDIRPTLLQSIEMKCVVYHKVNQTGKRNGICVKKCYILLRNVKKICCPVYILVRRARNI